MGNGNLSDSKKEEILEQKREAREQGTPITRFTASLPELSLEDGWDIFHRWRKKQIDQGREIVGRKGAFTNRLKALEKGIESPLWGVLFEDTHLLEEEPIPWNELMHPHVEAELAFLFEDDLTDSVIKAPDVLSAVKGVTVAIEVVDSLYEEYDFELPDLLIDNTSAARFYLSGQLKDPRELSLTDQGCVVRRNGQVVETAASGTVMGNPVNSIAWIAQRMREADEHIKAGEVVLSGSFTPIIPVELGDSISVSMTEFEPFSIRVAEED